MAKKQAKKFIAVLELNPEKAGAWMAEVSISNLYDGPNARLGAGNTDEAVVWASRSAWKNASAAKRWIKSQVLENTPRKSVKMVANKFDKATEKPTAFSGLLEYKE